MVSPKSYARAYFLVTASLDPSERVAWLMVLDSKRIQRTLTRILQTNNATEQLGQLGMPAPISRFLLVLAEDRALKHLPTIAEQGLRILAQSGAGTPVRLVSATQLTRELQAEIAEGIAVDHPKPVVLETSQKPALLGGFVLDIGTQRIDQSFAGRIAALKRTLQTA